MFAINTEILKKIKYHIFFKKTLIFSIVYIKNGYQLKY